MSQHNGDFQILDFSGFLELVPRTDTLLSSMNLFDTSFGRTDTIKVERVQDIVVDIEANRRGGERNYVGSETAKVRNFNIPFFTLDRQIQAGDVQNFRAYGTENAPKTVEQVVMRTLTRIRRSHDLLKEKAMWAAVGGKSYAPGAAAAASVYDYYDEFDVQRQLAPVDFTAVNIDPTDVIEAEARAWIIDNAGDNGDNYEITVLASRKWFTALVNHPLVTNAYQYYSSAAEPLRNRLGGNANNRRFVHKNITFIEDISGNVPADGAYILPKGIPDMFQLHYAPADDVDYANTVAQEIYVWYKQSNYLRQKKIETETSFLAVNARPELVVFSKGKFA